MVFKSRRFLLFFFFLNGPLFAQFNGDGLKGIYFINTNLTSAAATVVDPQPRYQWFGCPPQPGMSGVTFSVQWTGQVEAAYSEPTTFTVDLNGGVSLIVNGQTLVNQWTDYGPPVRGFSGVITLTANTKYSIELDYFTSGANPATDGIQLVWESPSQANEIIPHQYLFSGAALNPTPTPQTPSSCQAGGAGIVVDGALNEWPWSIAGWNTVNRTVLGNVYGTTASFKTLWDSTNLYFGVTVIDAQLYNTGTASLWRNSTVELYLDTTDSGSVTTGNNDFEFFFRWGDTAAVEFQGRTTGVNMATTSIPGGYVVEVSIPWSTLGLPGPGSGTVLGFDVGVDVNHNGGNCRDGQLIWNGGADDYANPSRFAQLTLAAACPTPVATPPAPTGQPYVSPNPSAGNLVRFTYQMAQPGRAVIRVWNAWGNLTATLNDPKSSGLQSSQLDVSTFAPGHYLYRVELDYDSGQSEKFRTAVMAIQK